MMSHTHVTGSLQRPTLVDYLIVAEQDTLDLSLKLYVGALEVGLIGVETGRLVYADLPGAKGDLAVSLLSRLPSPRVVPEVWVSRTPNIHAPWRELIDGLQWDSPLGRSHRCVLIRAELRELDAELASGVLSCPGRPQPSGDAAKALGIVTELLDWAWIEAYLCGDLEQARALVHRRELLCPGEAMCVANLERLRLRLLEDDLDDVTAMTG